MASPEFGYTDENGDGFSVVSFAGRDLTLFMDARSESVVLGRQAVAALQVFLTEWQERTTPAPPTPEPLLRSMTRQAVEQLAEPLCHRVIPQEAHLASRCTFCGHLWAAHKPAEADPEPKEVGHPEEPVTAPRQLVGCECGHRWGVHGGAQCHAALDDGEGDRCTCTRRTQADVNNGVRP